MGSLSQALKGLTATALLGALCLFAPSQAAAEGPIPTDPAKIEVWVAQWPAWKLERQRLESHLADLRQRLKEDGEAEASGGRPSWWDLPSRQRQAGRLRYLQHLRLELERAETRRFQGQAVEALWRTELEARQAKGALPETLSGVLKELREQAEKDLKDKEESK